MLECVLALAGGAAQLAALAALLHGDGATGATGAFLAYLGMQAAAAAMLAMPLRRLLARYIRTPIRPASAYLLVAGAFVPLGGLLVVLLGMALAAPRPRARAARGLAFVPLPESVSGPGACVSHGAGPNDGRHGCVLPGSPDRAAGRLRAELANAAASDARRLSALGALQAMPARSTSPLLRALLDDSIDDVRLLAYGMLDAAEQRLTRQILQAQDCLHALGDDGDPASRAAVHEHLAQLHWELVYQNLAQGDVRSHTLEQADRHAEAALQALSQAPGATTLYLRAADGSGVASPVAGLWQLRGRLALARRDPAAARAALQRATALGFPRERALPLLAEAAYLEGDFAAVGAAMRSLRQAASLPALPQLQPLLRYWTS
ncbi:lipopolysaccharide N-acetylglucosaminyl transferase [Cupriavidus gilardii]|uniref:lipopolysaccharide N-acetylglucosaminyl transferase n=1 Tax=Cupriavidus gilardii TaxID=82541 RepID=UPI001EE54FC7|nr:lipopolysaccharide N-acetylglucosaminyl transferase [Cupriavidus gilardii]MCG5258858.1 lipopolysaccharide N-acetylglucosaminyl transferase [Cupriavidus gilardii]MDF9429020.1 lipopolysaccharide N-acetylglucosaminyl transferase [Cupriavidus gilardii]